MYKKVCKICKEEFEGGRSSQFCKDCGDKRTARRNNNYYAKNKIKLINQYEYMLSKYHNFLKMVEPVEKDEIMQGSFELIEKIIVSKIN